MLQVFASDLRLPAHRLDACDPLQRENMAVRRAERKIPEIKLGLAEAGRRPNTHANLLQQGRNLCHDPPVQEEIGYAGRFGRVDTFESRFDPVDADIKSVASRVNTVAHLNDSADLTNPSGDLPCRRNQNVGVITIKLDLNRLRNRGKIADQILHQLRQLDVQTWHLIFDARADGAHHREDRAAPA